MNTGSISCSESSDKMGNHVWEFEFEEGLKPVFSEHSLSTDNSMLTSSFASEPTVKTHNNSLESLHRTPLTDLFH